MVLSRQSYMRIVRASGWYDVLVTVPFATPWTFALLLPVLGQIEAMLGLPSTLPTFEPLHMLFANLLGSVVVVWGLVRLRMNIPVLGRYDVISRVLFAAWQIYAVMHGASLILLFFIFFEVFWGILQMLPYTDAEEEK